MKIGILGGGQLGRMFIQNALKYDDDFCVLDPDQQAPCSKISSEFVVGDFGDFQTVLDFGKDKDIVTIEIEHVNVQALEQLQKEGVKVIPSPFVIGMIQQKIQQKEFYKQNNIPTSYFQVFRKGDEVKIRFPFVQKLNTGGYDGKGVQVIKSSLDLDRFWQEDSVLEELVDIEKELSVIVAVNENGEIKTFPVTEMLTNEQLNLLDFNISPAEIKEEVAQEIDKIVQKFVNNIKSSGLFAIELFLDKKQKVWVNEIAPRLHNSGHLTQEGNANSQFEQMYRVIKNLPLANTEGLAFCGMLNLVGEEGFSGKVKYDGLDFALKLENTYIHTYGKQITKPGRKMGHINVVANTKKELLDKLMEIKSNVKVVSK